jgi:hypothetical protein
MQLQWMHNALINLNFWLIRWFYCVQGNTQCNQVLLFSWFLLLSSTSKGIIVFFVILGRHFSKQILLDVMWICFWTVMQITKVLDYFLFIATSSPYTEFTIISFKSLWDTGTLVYETYPLYSLKMENWLKVTTAANGFNWKKNISIDCNWPN